MDGGMRFKWHRADYNRISVLICYLRGHYVQCPVYKRLEFLTATDRKRARDKILKFIKRNPVGA